MTTSRALPAALAVVSAVALCACTAEPSTGNTDLRVAAAVYPLAFAAQEVAGVHGEVLLLTAPGVEPHDLELSPAVVKQLRDMDVVFYLERFQPAIEKAVDSTGAWALGVEQMVEIHDHSDGDHDGHPDIAENEHDSHFWLNPLLLADFGFAIANEFGRLDLTHADGYLRRARSLESDLLALDAEFSAGLAACERDTILVSHEAFGFLATRYGLTQVGLAGLSPDAEPSPARVRKIRAIAAQTGATTVFSETLVDPSVAQALASDAGLEVAVLDPIEGLFDDDDDYFTVMRRNLAALEDALGCR